MNTDPWLRRKIVDETAFPLSVIKLRGEKKKNLFNQHWHNELEFLVVQHGSAIFRINSEEYKVSAGEAIFVNSCELHSGYPSENSNCNSYAVIFSPVLLYGFNGNITERIFFQSANTERCVNPVLIKRESCWGKKVVLLLSRIKQLYESGDFAFELAIKALLYEIFFYILSFSDITLSERKIRPVAHNEQRIEQAIKHIHSNYERRIHISELAAVAGLSEGYFYRLFRQVVKKTPIEYINRYRVNKAAILLLNTHDKITKIAIDTGFDSSTRFIDVFKKYMQCTPTEYRNLNRNN
jgi:AraC-like DNA-binding protein/quercetin dioxygenase-like cupin family protein